LPTASFYDSIGVVEFKRFAGSTLAAALIAIAVPASAQNATPDKKVCIAAAERGQELRNAQKMRDARAQFVLCAKRECPAAVAGECAKWAAEAEAALSTIKLDALDSNGKKLTDIKVSIDGAPYSDEIPKESVFVDPGSHQIRFDRNTSGSDGVLKVVSLAMGERDHVVQAVFKADSGAASSAAPAKETPAKETPTETNKEGGSLVAPIVLGGVGVVAIGAAGAFWLMGNSELDDARAKCTNGCVDADADGAKQKHLIGDIALGVGIVAIAAATYFLITREKAPQPVIRF
jgi:hypothetical protein